jgi:hypothetical protein
MWCPFSRVMMISGQVVSGGANRTVTVIPHETETPTIEVNNLPPGTTCLRQECACWDEGDHGCGLTVSNSTVYAFTRNG